MNPSMIRRYHFLHILCVCVCICTHREDGQQLLDRKLWLQSLLKHANSLVFQVIIWGDAAIRKRFYGALILHMNTDLFTKSKHQLWLTYRVNLRTARFPVLPLCIPSYSRSVAIFIYNIHTKQKMEQSDIALLDIDSQTTKEIRSQILICPLIFVWPSLSLLL